MATMRITKRAVDALEATHKEVVIWDDKLPGFGVRVKPSGAKSYLIQYRIRGVSRRMTIGRHGRVTADEARKAARQELSAADRGDDPIKRKEAVQVLTVAELCDRYLKEGCGHKKESTIATDRGRIERHIKPLLGKRRLDALTIGDIERMRNAITAGKTAVDEKLGFRARARVTGGAGTAKKAVKLLSAIYSFAKRHRIYEGDNPCEGVQTVQDTRMERFLSQEEMERIGVAMAELEQEASLSPSAFTAVRLLALTGARKSEILTARFEDVNSVLGVLRLADSKTGQKTIPLGRPALQLIEASPRIQDNPYICPGDLPGDHYKGLTKAWERIRNRAGLSDVRLHDWRHTFASHGAMQTGNIAMVSKLLGHANVATTERYAHLANDPLRAAADGISEMIGHAISPSTSHKGLP